MNRSFWMLVLATTLAALAPSSAGAQPLTATQRTEARQHQTAGDAALDAGRYLEAAREYDAVARIVPADPSSLYNAGRAYARGHEPQTARDRYEAFLRHARGPTGALRAEVEAALRLLDTEIAATRPATPPQTPVVTPTPANGTTNVATQTPPQNTIVPPVQTPHPRSPQLVRPFPWGPLVLGTLGIGALGFGIWSAVVSADAASTRDQSPRDSVTYELMAGRHDNAMVGAIISCLGGAALIGGGALWYALRGPGERREDTTPSISLAPLANGGGLLAVAGRF